MDRPDRFRRRALLALIFSIPFASLNATAQEESEQVLRDQALKLLGKHVFFDSELSNPKGNQACASCHEPFAGGTSGFSDVNETSVVVPGATAPNIGNRKPPTNAYASFSPPWQPAVPGSPCNLFAGIPFCGGNFWDGRSQGNDTPVGNTAPAPHLGDEVFYNIENAAIMAFGKYKGPTSDQALNPMPNPAEQNIARIDVCERVENSIYAPLYKLAWGVDLDCSATLAYNNNTHYDISFKRLMLSVGAYQHSEDINTFSSKRDMALRAELACDGSSYPEHYDAEFCALLSEANKDAGQFPLLLLTEEENLGHDIFYQSPFGPPGPVAAGACALCHSGPGEDGTEPLQLYTDHSYHNIGVPHNPHIPNSPDPGLSNHLLDALPGPVRTPTLRNTSKGAQPGVFTKAYTHNGWFKSLETLVHFYNTRDVKVRCETLIPETIAEGTDLTAAVALEHNCWPSPEFPDTAVGGPILGNLGLTSDEEAALVAYIRTLNDAHTAERPILLDETNIRARRIFTMFQMQKWDREICVIGGISSSAPAADHSGRPCLPLSQIIELLEEDDWLIQ
ncbi:cytochrome-c peroxidase [Microbulbifer agarilyticus]|uniref:cytochrome-c peroxidase n=1 Tax=Microbulbifer agarilyticus TaxID=260552 RepID=UPI001CD53EA3|nr:cytochrome c peroxidase [Microbulbifer agarilyticus]MCA0901021.1 hypothetical protein [Microbulbifer agarilyticus]